MFCKYSTILTSMHGWDIAISVTDNVKKHNCGINKQVWLHENYIAIIEVLQMFEGCHKECHGLLDFHTLFISGFGQNSIYSFLGHGSSEGEKKSFSRSCLTIGHPQTKSQRIEGLACYK